jgi:hypothetical protein
VNTTRTNKGSIAGRKSGLTRAAWTEIRRFFVLAAFERLKPPYQMQPYAEDSLEALECELRRDVNAGNPAEHELSPPLGPYESLAPSVRQPFSDQLSDALLRAANAMLTYGPGPSTQPSRETLKKDLKALGIRSRRTIRRPG